MNEEQNKLQTKLFVSMMIMTFSIGIAIYMQSLALDYFDTDSSMSMSCTKLAYLATGFSIAGLFTFIKTAVIIEKTR